MSTLLSRFNSIAIGVLAYFAVNLVAGHFIPTARLDFTEHRLYTLTDNSREIVSKLDNSIVLRLFVSKSQLVQLPAIASYVSHVEDVLQEYARLSNGKIDLQIIEPEPFSEEEDRAVGFGIQSFPVTRSDELGYFGLVGSNSLDERQVIPFISPDREQLLEYELTRMIYRLANPERKVVGIISSLPIQGLAGLQPLQGASLQPWVFFEQLQELFEVRVLRPQGEPLPDDLDLLVLIHPKNLTEMDVFNIDQFVLKGKSLLVLVDAHSEVNAALMQNLPQLEATNTSSNFDLLTSKWGVTQLKDKIVADLAVAARILDPQGTAGQTIEYPVWMNIQPSQLNQTDAVTANLGNVIFASAGSLQLNQQSNLSLTPLIITSPQAAIYNYSDASKIDNIRELLSKYSEGNQPQLLAVRISGEAKTAFPDGAPDSSETITDQTSSGNINVIVINDTDFLQDHFWIRKEQLGKSVLNFATASNGQLIENAVDNLTGNEALINVRARGSYYRTFDRLQEIRRAAELKFLQHEQQLVEQLQVIDQLVSDFTTSQSREGGGLILSDEQQEEFRTARSRQLQLRNELREVRRNLHKDIERIEFIISLLNIIVIPSVIAVIGLTIGIFGFKRRHQRLARAVTA